MARLHCTLERRHCDRRQDGGALGRDAWGEMWAALGDQSVWCCFSGLQSHLKLPQNYELGRPRRDDKYQIAQQVTLKRDEAVILAHRTLAFNKFATLDEIRTIKLKSKLAERAKQGSTKCWSVDPLLIPRSLNARISRFKNSNSTRPRLLV